MALGVELVLLYRQLLPLDTPYMYSLLTLASQRFLSTLRDEVTLYLRRETESKCQYLRLDVLAKTIVVLHCPDTTLLAHADVQYLHDHKEVTTQA